MSIASTYAVVSSGSARLSAVHVRTQSAAEVATTARSMSPVEAAMRRSPTRLHVRPSTAHPRMHNSANISASPSRPVTAGSARPFTSAARSDLSPYRDLSAAAAAMPLGFGMGVGAPLFSPSRPATAPRASSYGGSGPSSNSGTTAARFAASASPLQSGRPGTAYAPRRAAQLAAAAEGRNPFESSPMGAPSPVRGVWGFEASPQPRHGSLVAHPFPLAGAASPPPPLADVCEEEGSLADALAGMKLSDARRRGDAEEGSEWEGPKGPIADDSLLAALETAYDGCRGAEAAPRAYAARGAETPSAEAFRLREAHDAAMERLQLSARDPTSAAADGDECVDSVEEDEERCRHALLPPRPSAPTPASLAPHDTSACSYVHGGMGVGISMHEVGCGSGQEMGARISDPDTLLLWLWSFVESDPRPFLQAVKRGCGIGETMALNVLRQCEAIVDGVTKGDLPYDVPTVLEEEEGNGNAPSASSSAAVGTGGRLQRRKSARMVLAEGPIVLLSPAAPMLQQRNAAMFLERYTSAFCDCVRGAVRLCAEQHGAAWCPMADSLWSCVLLHMRVALERDE